jgi:hypothetical protein
MPGGKYAANWVSLGWDGRIAADIDGMDSS